MNRAQEKGCFTYLMLSLGLLFSLAIEADSLENFTYGATITMGIAASTYLLYNVIKYGKRMRPLFEYSNARITLFQARAEFEKSLEECFKGNRQTSAENSQKHIAC